MKTAQISNVMEMLKSPDEENHILALGIIEAQDLVKMTAALMLCYKFGKPKRDVWEKEAPNALRRLEEIGEIKPYTGFSFKQVYEEISQPTANMAGIETFFKEYAEYLSNSCGHKNIDRVEIIIHKKK